MKEMAFLQREGMYFSSGGLSSLRSFEALSGNGGSSVMGWVGGLYIVGKVFWWLLAELRRRVMCLICLALDLLIGV